MEISSLQFRYEEGLLYFKDVNSRLRLCIPILIQKEIFEEAHDSRHHFGFRRTYESIYLTIFVNGLSKVLRKYINHYPQYLTNQTRRHKPYGSLESIGLPFISYHTVIMDFVVGFSEIQAKNTPWAIYTNMKDKVTFDSAFIMTCKHSKRILIIPEHLIYTASQWAEVALRSLLLEKQGVPKKIISNRDFKFLSEFWITLFKSLDTKILIITAWYP